LDGDVVAGSRSTVVPFAAVAFHNSDNLPSEVDEPLPKIFTKTKEKISDQFIVVTHNNKCCDASSSGYFFLC
jgi:hypothetical protein